MSPDYAEPHNGMGMIAWNAQDKQEALGHFRTALAIDGSNRDALSNFVTTAYELEQFGEVETLLGSLFEENSQDVDLLVLLRDCYNRQGKRDGAARVLEQAERLTQGSELAGKARAEIAETMLGASK